MDVNRQSYQTLVAAALIALAAIPGGLALMTTDARVHNAHVFDGSYQRVYEERFERELAGREMAQHLWSTLRLTLLNEVASGAVLGSDGWLFTAEEFIEPSDPRDLLTEMEAARDALAPLGARLVPVILPDKARIMARHLPLQRSEAFEARYEEVLRGLAARDFPAIDLRPALAGDKTDPPGFMKTDTHWSPAGAARVAAAIADTVTAPDLPRTGFASHHVGREDFDGDLLAFVDVGPFRPHFPLLQEEIDRFESDASGGSAALGLFDAPEIAVALVGTSYSARQDFHFEGFLKSALQADLVNYAEEGLGPFAPMDRFLAALGEMATPPELVLWEIPERYITTRIPQ